MITVGRAAAQGLRRRLLAATRPAVAPLAAGTIADLAQSKPALVAENALLRHQLAILHRSVKRPRCTPTDRALLVLLASRLGTWRQALLIIQPETVLRWHRQGCCLVWRRKSRPLLFRPLYAFFMLELASRRVVHVGVTRHPTDAWVAQQLREATPEGRAPKYLIRDNDSKFGPAFAGVAEASGIAVRRTAYQAPRMNATCERFLGSLRRACLDHVLILGERHLRRVLREYVHYFNQLRPHQGSGSSSPVPRDQHRPGGTPSRPRRSWAVYTTTTGAWRKMRPRCARMSQTASTGLNSRGWVFCTIRGSPEVIRCSA